MITTTTYNVSNMVKNGIIMFILLLYYTSRKYNYCKKKTTIAHIITTRWIIDLKRLHHTTSSTVLKMKFNNNT